MEKGDYETVLCQTKIRWSRRHEGNPKEQEAEWIEGESLKVYNPQEVIELNKDREIYDPDLKTVNWTKQKATDMRNNPRVYLPKSRPNGEELELGTKAFMYQQTIEKYQEQFCNDKGTQIRSNLTKSEQNGIRKLKARQKCGQIVINTSDKSQVTSISTRENYEAQCRQHIGPKDLKLTWKAVNPV